MRVPHAPYTRTEQMWGRHLKASASLVRSFTCQAPLEIPSVNIANRARIIQRADQVPISTQCALHARQELHRQSMPWNAAAVFPEPTLEAAPRVYRVGLDTFRPPTVRIHVRCAHREIIRLRLLRRAQDTPPYGARAAHLNV
jgi:hypothetical protein